MTNSSLAVDDFSQEACLAATARWAIEASTDLAIAVASSTGRAFLHSAAWPRPKPPQCISVGEHLESWASRTVKWRTEPSKLDTLHPGRDFATTLPPNEKSAEELAARAHAESV